MKAAYANGVLTAFEQADYHPWDLVIGTSAGGAMAAWYSAGQAEYAEETWKYVSDRRILSYRRWLRRKGPLLDHEALLEIVYLQEHPLDVEAVKRAPWPVVVTAVDVATGDTVYHDVREEPTIQWLKATGRLPLASGDPVRIDGRSLLDGGIVDPIPIRYALTQGRCNDITLITNKPPGIKRSDPKFLVERAAKKYPALRKGMEEHQLIKWESMQLALNPPPGVAARIIAPSRPTSASRMGRNLDGIRDAIALGQHDGAAFLAQQGL